MKIEFQIFFFRPVYHFNPLIVNIFSTKDLQYIVKNDLNIFLSKGMFSESKQRICVIIGNPMAHYLIAQTPINRKVSLIMNAILKERTFDLCIKS